MRVLVVCLALLSVALVARAHPICLDFSFPVARTLSFCSQYSNSTCCTTAQDSTARTRWQNAINATRFPQCAALHRELECARCDPWAGHIYDAEDPSRPARSEALMCPDFCARYFAACADAPLGTNNATLASQFGNAANYCTPARAQASIYCYPVNLTILDGEPSGLVRAFPLLNRGFAELVEMVHAPTTRSQLYIVTKAGVIFTMRNSRFTTSAQVFLNITSRVRNNGEQGLLGLAFHPDFERGSPFFFVNYISASGATVISRFTANLTSANASSELFVLRFSQPYENHNGGWMGFSPADSMLYIASGDGGSANDPQNYGQNTSTLLGKILRIDVRASSPAQPYVIPSDNPFVGQAGYRGEIFALGLRNPWKCSFDGPTLYCGDVGQGRWEEVSIVGRGQNMGWKVLEGFRCLSNDQLPPGGCNDTGLTPPIFVYPHQSSSPIHGQSITGGYVYRGAAVPSLRGRYVFGDFQTQRVFAIGQLPSGEWVGSFLVSSGFLISSFAVDGDSELYVLEYTGGNSGTIWRFPDERALRSVPVRMRLTNASFAALNLTAGSASRANFESAFAADIANALNINVSQVEVSTVTRSGPNGTVVTIEFAIRKAEASSVNLRTPDQLVDDLRALVANTSSPLYSGSVTAATDSSFFDSPQDFSAALHAVPRLHLLLLLALLAVAALALQR
jgi:glucose/arabinose dehydrogenase